MDWFFNLLVANFLDSLFTGLMVAAIIVFVFRYLGVRGVMIRIDIESRDRDPEK